MLPTFYRAVTAAIRSAGAHQVIFPEGIADSAQRPPVLPRLPRPPDRLQLPLLLHPDATVLSGVPIGTPSSQAAACAGVDARSLGRFTQYAARLGVPGFLSEFSCNDVNPDNARVVDIVDNAFTSWTAWAYYP